MTVSDVDGVVATIEVDWGDGTPPEIFTAPPFTDVALSRRYLTIDPFTVSVTITDNRLDSTGPKTREFTPVRPRSVGCCPPRSTSRWGPTSGRPSSPYRPR
ncbi:MAG: hypothetical protein AAF602_11125 [Myxococcota bacterium]